MRSSQTGQSKNQHEPKEPKNQIRSDLLPIRLISTHKQEFQRSKESPGQFSLKSKTLKHDISILLEQISKDEITTKLSQNFFINKNSDSRK